MCEGVKAMVSVLLTEAEYGLLERVLYSVAKHGLPMEILQGKDIGEYLESVHRSQLCKGSIAGLGLTALLYLMDGSE